MYKFRPADAIETAGAWKIAIESTKNPTAIILTRQNVTTLKNTSVENVGKGAYIVGPEVDRIDAIIIATGSEVNLAMEAKEALFEQGIDVRVVSMPSMELFEKQDDDYKEMVLPRNIRARLSIEMASDFGWHKYVGLDGKTMSVSRFGTSAPASVVIENYGFTVENVIKNIKDIL